jgi:hypothetical protein
MIRAFEHKSGDRVATRIYSHPTRENRRTRQPSPNRAISDHEHLRLIRVFSEVALLDPNSDKNDTAEEDRQAADDAVAVGLGEELDCHLVRSVAALLADWIKRVEERLHKGDGRYLIAT